MGQEGSPPLRQQHPGTDKAPRYEFKTRNSNRGWSDKKGSRCVCKAPYLGEQQELLLFPLSFVAFWGRGIPKMKCVEQISQRFGGIQLGNNIARGSQFKNTMGNTSGSILTKPNYRLEQGCHQFEARRRFRDIMGIAKGKN